MPITDNDGDAVFMGNLLSQTYMLTSSRAKTFASMRGVHYLTFTVVGGMVGSLVAEVGFYITRFTFCAIKRKVVKLWSSS